MIDSLPSAFETVKLSVRLGSFVDPVPGSPSATGADDDDDEDELSISGVDTSERRKNCQGQKKRLWCMPDETWKPRNREKEAWKPRNREKCSL